MTEVDPSVTVHVESLEALDWEIPCERILREAGSDPAVPKTAQSYVACGGEGVAEWALFRACGCAPYIVLHCSACKDRVLAAPVLRCYVCDTRYKPGSTAHSFVEPIGGS